MDKTPNIDRGASSSKNEQNDSGHETIEEGPVPLLKQSDNQRDGNQEQSPRKRDVRSKVVDKLPQPQAVVLCLKCGRENTPQDLRFHNIADSVMNSQRSPPYTLHESTTSRTDEGIGLSSRTLRNETKLNVKRAVIEVQNNEQNISQSEESHLPSRELNQVQYEESDLPDKENITSQSEESHEPNIEQNISQAEETLRSNRGQNIYQSEETHITRKTDNLDIGINTYASQSSNVHQETTVNTKKVGSAKSGGIWKKRSFDQPERRFYLEQRKREAQLAREEKERVRKLIEQDKINRKLLFKNSESTPKPKTELLQTFWRKSKTPVKIRKQYSRTKLLIRLTNGDTLVETFRSDDKLTSVLFFIEENRTDDECPFILRTVYPKRTFYVDEYESPLNKLDLPPASVLIVSRKYKKSDERSKASFPEKKSQVSFSQRSVKSPSNASRPND